MKQHNLAPGDFPDLEPFRAKLVDTNFIKFPKLKTKMLEDLDEVHRRPYRNQLFFCLARLYSVPRYFGLSAVGDVIGLWV